MKHSLIPEEDLLKMKQDIAEIKVALIGNELIPSGLITKVDKNTKDIGENEKKISKVKTNNQIAYGIGSGLFGLLVIILSIWDHIISFIKG